MKRRPWSHPCPTSIAPRGERRSGWPPHTGIALAGILGLALLVLSL